MRNSRFCMRIVIWNKKKNGVSTHLYVVKNACTRQICVVKNCCFGKFNHFAWIRFLVWNILFSFEQPKIYRIEEKHAFLDENCDLEQETDSEHTNVLLEMLLLDKFNRFCVNKVSGVKYFLLLRLSENTHYVMKNTHFCLRIVIYNKKWGQSNLMCS